MKTKEQLSNPIMPLVLDKNFTREEKEKFIHKIMDEFAQQFKPVTMKDRMKEAFGAAFGMNEGNGEELFEDFYKSAYGN